MSTLLPLHIYARNGLHLLLNVNAQLLAGFLQPNRANGHVTIALRMPVPGKRPDRFSRPFDTMNNR